MLKVAFAFVAIVALARADIEQEVANERGEIEYRLSFKTRDAEKADDHFHSVGKFSVEFIGKDGTTGPQELIDHPSMVKSDDGSWKKQDGMVQVAKVNAPNVGELKEVKTTGTHSGSRSIPMISTAEKAMASTMLAPMIQ